MLELGRASVETSEAARVQGGVANHLTPIRVQIKSSMSIVEAFFEKKIGRAGGAVEGGGRHK
jgi:hypothetical protein